MNYQMFLQAAEQVAESKGIEVSDVLVAIKEAIARGYTKALGGGDDAVVDVTLDEEHGTILISQIKDVVPEVEDDYLEISPEDALATADEELEHIEERIGELSSKSDKDEIAQLKYLASLVDASKKLTRPGDRFPIYCPLEDIGKYTYNGIKNALRGNLKSAEQTALYEVYKDHIGEMVTGTVEKAGEKSVSVNIGRAVVELTYKELIGDELFRVGDPIKVYIQEVKETRDENGKVIRGPQIEITRSSAGFLKRLFEEEIHEIYEGTVVIKGIAREAGVRSKVAVYSKDEDIDPTGSCIGPKGSRIQKIVQQLGNGKEKEKIDIIAYSDYMPLYIAESLRPAQVVGVAMEGEGDDENARPKAVCVVSDNDVRLAVGRKGANVRLAKKLTGWDILKDAAAGCSFEANIKLADGRFYVTNGGEQARPEVSISGQTLTFVWNGLSVGGEHLDIRFTGTVSMTSDGLVYGGKIENGTDAVIEQFTWPFIGEITIPEDTQRMLFQYMTYTNFGTEELFPAIKNKGWSNLPEHAFTLIHNTKQGLYVSSMDSEFNEYIRCEYENVPTADFAAFAGQAGSKKDVP